MWSPTLQTLIGHLFQHVDDAENIVVSTVFELLEPMPSEICFMLWLQRENLGVQRQIRGEDRQGRSRGVPGAQGAFLPNSHY